MQNCPECSYTLNFKRTKKKICAYLFICLKSPILFICKLTGGTTRLCFVPQDLFLFNVDLRKWQPTPVLLPGESHGGKSLVGYSPWGRKESDMTERLHIHFKISCWVPTMGVIHTAGLCRTALWQHEILK